jgi:Domain of unknown function (DUF4214)
LAPGVQGFTARQIDVAGNPGTPSALFTETIDTIAPTIMLVTTSGPGISAGSGNLKSGAIVTLSVLFSEPMVVAGSPVLRLNVGQATFVPSGLVTDTLTFVHTVVAGETTADLTTTGLALNGILLTDVAGNALKDPTGAVTNPAGTLRIDATDAVPGSVFLDGPHSQYVIVDDGGSLHIQTIAGQGGPPTLPSDNVMVFTDGVGLFDPTGTAEDVDRLYSAALSRAPDVSGLKFWTAQADDSHVSLSDVANSFAASPEFINNYGALSDLAFVQQLYQNVLDRPGEASGVQFWQDALAAGTSRGAVLLSFAEGAENQAKTLPTAGDKNNAEAYRLYQAALDRAPDQGGLSFWSSTLKGGTTPDQVAQSFIESSEFQQKYGSLGASDFVSQLYQNVLHRAGDPGGQQFWTSQLQGGLTQSSVLVGFSDSPENRSQTASATHDGWVFIHA